MKIDEFFADFHESQVLFDHLLDKIKAIDPFTIHVSKSQIAFKRQKTFAIIWIPARYLHSKSAPLVLTMSFPYRHNSPRWKEIVEISTRHFTHHLELYTNKDIDHEVCEWILQAWANAT